MPMLISVVHQMCTYALYVETTFCSSDHHSHLNGAERRAETPTMMKQTEQRSQELDHSMHMSCMHFHSLPSARVIPVWPLFNPQNHLGIIGPIRKGKACCVDSANMVCVQEYPVHSHVDGLRVLSGDILSVGLK